MYSVTRGQTVAQWGLVQGTHLHFSLVIVPELLSGIHRFYKEVGHAQTHTQNKPEVNITKKSITNTTGTYQS